jgi:SAM-dependent methyltransferase
VSDIPVLLQRKLVVIAGGRVLDVATGTGDFALLLAESLASYDEVAGIDNLAEPLATAAGRKLPPRISFVREDASRMTFADASFDTVGIANSLHHMADLPAVLAEMKRVLRPGGAFIVAEMVCDGLTPAQQTHDLMHRLIAELNRVQGIPHNQTFTRAELTALYLGLSLSDVEMFETAPTEEPTRDAAEDSEFLRRFGQQAKTARSLPGLADWQRRAADLTERVRKVGIQPPPQLWLIGTKP